LEDFDALAITWVRVLRKERRGARTVSRLWVLPLVVFIKSRAIAAQK
jgi:hypothetical protein